MILFTALFYYFKKVVLILWIQSNLDLLTQI